MYETDGIGGIAVEIYDALRECGGCGLRSAVSCGKEALSFTKDGIRRSGSKAFEKTMTSIETHSTLLMVAPLYSLP